MGSNTPNLSLIILWEAPPQPERSTARRKQTRSGTASIEEWTPSRRIISHFLKFYSINYFSTRLGTITQSTTQKDCTTRTNAVLTFWTNINKVISNLLCISQFIIIRNGILKVTDNKEMDKEEVDNDQYSIYRNKDTPSIDETKCNLVRRKSIESSSPRNKKIDQQLPKGLQQAVILSPSTPTLSLLLICLLKAEHSPLGSKHQQQPLAVQFQFFSAPRLLHISGFFLRTKNYIESYNKERSKPHI